VRFPQDFGSGGRFLGGGFLGLVGGSGVREFLGVGEDEEQAAFARDLIADSRSTRTLSGPG
jgi:hypothetical protein